MLAILPLRRLFGSSLLIVAALISGCATTTTTSNVSIPEETVLVPETVPPEHIPVVRYGRYTLVELAPLAAQSNLLLQVVDVTMPENVHASVGDGLRHVLKRSGYQLCESAPGVIELFYLPLPLAHLHLGPMKLRVALLTFAVARWENGEG